MHNHRWKRWGDPLRVETAPGGKARSDDETRAVLLSRRIVTDSGCWEYTGYCNPSGYGEMSWRGSDWLVSRLAYALFSGPIPPDTNVCHSCDNPPCFNPAHLWLGSHEDNMRDAAAKERNGNSKLTIEDVLRIRQLLSEGTTQVTLAKRFAVTQGQISAIKLRKVWKHLPD